VEYLLLSCLAMVAPSLSREYCRVFIRESKTQRIIKEQHRDCREMWPTIPRSEERPSRPPTGSVRHSGGNGGRLPYSGSTTAGSLRSQQSPQRSLSPSVGSRRFYGGNTDSENDDDDGKDDDSLDTYVSVSTKGGRSQDETSTSKVAPTAPSSSSRGLPKSTSDSSRILQETLRASNKPMISRSSSTSSVVKKMKNQYEGYGDKSSSSSSNAEILDKLKKDINSLERLRSQTHQEEDFSERYSENEFSHLRSTSSFTLSSPGRLRDTRNNIGRFNSTMRSSQYDDNKLHAYGGNGGRSQSSMTAASRSDRTDSDEADTRSTSSFISSSPGRLRDLRNNNGRSNSTMRSSRYDGVKSYDYEGKGGRSQSLMTVSSPGVRVESEKTDARSKSSIGATVVKTPQYTARARSVDRIFRVTDPGGTTRKDTSSISKPSTHRLWENQNKKEEKGLDMAAENNELLKQLQETVCTLKEESIKTIEHYESRMSQFSDIQSQLEKSKSKEVELAKTLRGVLSNVESQQCVTSEELSIVYKLRESEVMLLEEKLKSALIEIADKTKAEQRLYNKIEDVECNWMKRLEESESDYDELNEKKSEILVRLSNAESENRSVRESMSKAKEEADKAVAAVKKLLKDTNDEKQEEISALRDSFLVAKEEAQAAHEKTTSLKQNIDEMNEANNRLELAFAEANIAKVNMELELNHVKGELENQTRNKANIEEEKRHYAAQVENLTATLSMTKAKHVQTESDLKASVEKAKEINAQMAQISLKLESAEHKIDALNGDVQERDKQIVKMNQVAETMQMKIEQAENDLETKDKKLTAYKEQLKEAKQETNMMHMKVQQAEKGYDVLKGKVQERDKQLMDQNKAKGILQKKVNDLKYEVGTYEAKNHAYEAKVSRLKADLGETKTKALIMENEVSSLQSELVRINERLELSEKQASGAQEREIELNDTIQCLQSELHTAKMNLERTESGAQERETELNGTIQDLQSDLSNLRTESESRKGQLKAALQSLNEMMTYITAMQDENDDVVASMEGDLEKAMKMKQDAEREMKKR
jgi:predicted  nucleic acid-binding Zn-ribbon protein